MKLYTINYEYEKANSHISSFLFFPYCKKENDCFKVERIIEIDGRYFFYWGSISSANIDSETPPAKTGEVSESDFKSYAEGNEYCPN